jgi:hypothetical protein
MNNQNKKDDVAGKPEAGARDSKGKHAQLDKHPRKGRERVPSTVGIRASSFFAVQFANSSNGATIRFEVRECVVWINL